MKGKLLIYKTMFFFCQLRHWKTGKRFIRTKGTAVKESCGEEKRQVCLRFRFFIMGRHAADFV